MKVGSVVAGAISECAPAAPIGNFPAATQLFR